MNFFRSPKDKLLSILTFGTAIILFFINLLNLILYATGTIREFVDSTQFSLLQINSVLGIFLITTSLFGIILVLVNFIRKRKVLSFLKAFGYLILVAFGTATVLAAMFIITISKGNM